MRLGVYQAEACNRCCGQGRRIDDAATGRRVRAARRKLGLSLSEFGKRMGISEGYVSDLELAKRNWDGELIAKAEAALIRQPPL